MFNKIEQYFRKKEIDKNGVYLGEITEGKNHMRALICLIRGFIIFLGTYGTLIGLLKAFELPYNALLVVPAFFLISMYLAFLYFHKFFFYPGYIFLLTAFTYELVHLYLYANSGYQAIVNEIYLAYSDYFKLLSVREGQELISQREITVTVAIIFVGIFVAMMLNVTISGYMNVFETMLVTVPFLEICFFINKKPPLYCLIMILTMYIFVGLLQASRHQRMQVKGKYTHEYTRYTRRNKKYYFYQGNAIGNVLTALFALAAAFIIGIVAFPTYQNDIEILNHNPVRTKVEEYVKIYVQSGFTGLINRYDDTGGMNSGRLGGIGEVRPDFETDLSVTFAPYTFSTVYLKGFTGSTYLQNQWHAIAALEPDEETLALETPVGPNYMPSRTIRPEEIQTFDAQYFPEAKATARMNVVNLDADPTFSYLPYYTDFTEYEPFKKSEENSHALENGVDITYHPAVDLFYDIPADYEGITDEEYAYYVNQSCTTVPENLQTVLTDYIAENKIFDEQITGHSWEENKQYFDDVNDYRLYVARKVYAHYLQNFKYTMAPGATPFYKDYVEYFLTTQQRGYCAHFASAGALLLRSMGVPARYVEGYCIPASLLAESGRGINEDYSEWYEGENLLDEHGVVNVEVNDSYAHAWIEIYMDGYGFVPFEMTIPSDEEETLDLGGFRDLFSGLFNVRFDIAELPDPNTTGNASELNATLSKLFNFNLDYRKFLLPLIIVTSLILAGLAGFFGIRALLETRRRKHLYASGNYRELVYINYTAFSDYLNSRSDIKTSLDNPLPQDVLAQLKRLLTNRTPDITEESLDKLFTYVESALYSPNPGTKEEYDRFVSTLTLLKKTLKNLK